MHRARLKEAHELLINDKSPNIRKRHSNCKRRVLRIRAYERNR